MASDAVLRGVRVLTLPSVLFASGLGGHAAAGGVTPDPSLLVPLFVLTVFAVAPFAGAPMRPACSMTLLVGGQGVLHAVLQLLSGRPLRLRQPCLARAPACRRRCRPTLI